MKVYCLWSQDVFREDDVRFHGVFSTPESAMTASPPVERDWNTWIDEETVGEPAASVLFMERPRPVDGVGQPWRRG